MRGCRLHCRRKGVPGGGYIQSPHTHHTGQCNKPRKPVSGSVSACFSVLGFGGEGGRGAERRGRLGAVGTRRRGKLAVVGVEGRPVGTLEGEEVCWGTSRGNMGLEGRTGRKAGEPCFSFMWILRMGREVLEARFGGPVPRCG